LTAIAIEVSYRHPGLEIIWDGAFDPSRRFTHDLDRTIAAADPIASLVELL
jgi:hypothetical protein